MKQLADNITEGELEELNVWINDLSGQVRVLDSESRRTDDGKILEWLSVAKEITTGTHF